MISRRKWLGSALSLCAISACASEPERPRMSLAKVLLLLPTLHSGADVIGQIGEPDYRKEFGHDDPSSDYWPNRFSLASWKEGTIASPPTLLDTMPVGTNLLLYRFGHGSGLNPTTDMLFVCIDATDRILGWMYGRQLLGNESKAVFMPNK